MVIPKLLHTLAMVSDLCPSIDVFPYAVLDPREYSISTKEFVLDDAGKLKGLNTGASRLAEDFIDIDASRLGIVRVEWTKDSSGRWKMEEVPGSGKFFPAQLVFLALGFLGPQSQALNALGIKQDARSNIQTPLKVCSATFIIPS
jgi:glutamate synthase (NADPH/NADH)